MARAALGMVLLAFTLAGCTALFSGVFGQDDPRLFFSIEPLYQLPLPRDRSHFMLVQGIGGSFSHTGDLTWAFDWSMPMNTPVRAARDGVVIAYRSESEDCNVPFEKRVANYVRIRQEDGTVAVYAHLDSTWLRPGDEVLAGDSIALSGNTGYSTQPHLHFHVERDGRTIPVAFRDVRDSGGIPRAGRLYHGN